MDSIEMMNIINQVDKSWSKDCIIRYLYVKLAPYFRRDLKYFLASDEEKYRQYMNGFTFNGPDICCSSLADFYVNLFASFNINALKIEANSSKIPLYAVIAEGDNGWFYMDPLGDLFNNQYGLDTHEFGIIPRFKTTLSNYPYLIRLNQEYMNEIDNYLGLYPENVTLTPYFEQLHRQMTDRNQVSKQFGISKDDFVSSFIKKAEFMNEHLINLGQVNGPLERIKMYQFLERQLFFKASKRLITIKLNAMSEDKNCVISYNFDDNYVEFEETKKNGEYILKRKK